MMRFLDAACSSDDSSSSQSSQTPKSSRSKKKNKHRSRSEGSSSAFCLSVLSIPTTPSHKHHKKRKRSEYEDNYSAALALPCTSEELDAIKNNSPALLALAADNIKEHAARRVDLFFYTMVAYYETGLTPNQSHTNLQHGKGRNAADNSNITQACHSSFLPSLTDENSYLQSDDAHEHNSILSDTHFLDSLNSTVELPIIVNEFDGELENTYACRHHSVKILQRVSMGEINPLEGLQQFLHMMSVSFQKIEAKLKTQGTMFSKIHPSEQELLLLVRQGTFNQMFSIETQKVTDEYIETLLNLKPAEKELCKNNSKQREKIYCKKITSLQAEILQTEKARYRIKSPSTPP